MAKRAKSSISGAIKKRAKDETNYGVEFIDLPGGITGGIAELVDIKFGEYKTGTNKGKQFFYAAGVVKSPKTALAEKKVFENGKVKTLETKEVNIEGQRTSMMIPLCQTKTRKGDVTSVEDHVANMLNEIRKLGYDTEDLESEEELESLFDVMKEEKPRFKFGTTQSEPNANYPDNPRIWENWYGVRDLNGDASEYEEEITDDVEDSTGEEGEEEDDIPFEEEETEAAEDIVALAEAADNEDEEAGEKLAKLAEDAGINHEEYETWVEVAEALSSGESSTEEYEPEEEEVVNYKPPRKRKAVECEVVGVDTGAKTCTLKNLDDGSSVYSDVPWRVLEV